MQNVLNIQAASDNSEFYSPVSALPQSGLKYVCGLEHSCGPFPGTVGRLLWLLWDILSVFCIVSAAGEKAGQARILEPFVLFLELSGPGCVTSALIQRGSHAPALRDC